MNDNAKEETNRSNMIRLTARSDKDVENGKNE
jgi:hypothetical protein